MTQATAVPHPAKYSDALLPLFWQICERYRPQSILDPMAGTGKIGKLYDFGYFGRIVANELEPEWAAQAPESVEVHVGDAANMTWAKNGEFDAIITSPVYGNRISDHHEARDDSRRNTYRHRLGRPLHPANTGQLQWGKAYRDAHRKIWRECIRVLKPGGIFVLNIKDHIRNGKLIEVSQWHRKFLSREGLQLLESHFVETPGNRFGANAHLRVEGEHVFVFRKAGTP